jgi:hypothetical protein
MGWKVVVLVAAAMMVAGIAFAASGGSSAVTLCAGKGGDLSLGKKGKCDKGEKKVTIAKQGPQGEQGAPGKDGTPEDLAPEPMHYLSPASASCQTQPGTSFCFSSGGPAWVNRGTGFAPVGYQKDAGGYVHLQGVISQGGSGAYFGDIAFYLPPGYRPTDGAHTFVVRSTDGGGATHVDVGTDGSVYVNDACCASLDGIVFHP